MSKSRILEKYEWQYDCPACGWRWLANMNEIVLVCKNPHCRNRNIHKCPIQRKLTGNCVSDIAEDFVEKLDSGEAD